MDTLEAALSDGKRCYDADRLRLSRRLVSSRPPFLESPIEGV